MIKSIGNLKNPKLIIVLPFPSVTEFEKGLVAPPFSPNYELRKILGSRIKDVCITFLIKKLYKDETKDPITGTVITGTYRNITQDELNIALKQFEIELAQFPFCKTIIACGNAYKLIKDKIPTSSEFKLIKATDPSKLNSEADFQKYLNFENTINMALFDPKFKDALAAPKTKILNPAEALEMLEETLELYKKKEIDHILFDLETTGLKAVKHDIVMFSIADTKRLVGYAVPLEVNNEIRFGYEKDWKPVDFTISAIDKVKIQRKLGEVLSTVPVTGHNIKFDLGFCELHDICKIKDFKVYNETQVLAFLIYNFKLDQGLKLETLCNKLLDVGWKDMIKSYLKLFPTTHDTTYGDVFTSLLGKYAANDAIYNLLLEQYLMSFLYDDIKDFNRETMSAVVKVTAQIEISGVAIDKKLFEFLKTTYVQESARYFENCFNLPEVFNYAKNLPKVQERLAKQNSPKSRIKPENILSEDQLVAKHFSLKSPMQIADLVYDVFKMPMINKKKPKSTDKNTLDLIYKRFKGMNKSFDLFYINYTRSKRFSNLSSKYINKISDEKHKDFFYPSYRICGTATARLSSFFHTTDGKSDLKRCYISRWADEGGLILSPDFSQAEVRVVASLANEEALIEAYTKGYDIHKVTASRTFGVPIEEVTHDQRQKGKTLVFAILYGMTPKGLADELQVSESEAQSLLDRFFKGYPSLKKWINKQVKQAEKNGYIKTIWGRRIPIDDINSGNKYRKAKAERACGNYPVQSGASDAVLYSARECFKNFVDKNLKSVQIGMVHDSYEVDVAPSELLKVFGIYKNSCEVTLVKNNDWIKAPIKVSMELGTSWGAGCIEFDIESFTGTELVATGTGLQRDINNLLNRLQMSYEANVEILNSKELGPSDFRYEIFVRDTIQHHFRLTIKEKQPS